MRLLLIDKYYPSSGMTAPTGVPGPFLLRVHSHCQNLNVLPFFAFAFWQVLGDCALILHILFIADVLDARGTET